MVHAHGVVGRNGAVDERKPLFGIVVAPKVLRDRVVLAPPLDDVAFQLYEVDLGIYRFKHVAWIPFLLLLR